ncbi:unnamed protein product [Brachionus calyciflorus]|uniref:Uncharacterized protein n=1 Tax=Brachionus calyciflorus TaxID=104777 RepID=A0A813Z9A4_9BILA|nr:unnamed protein product [Brachionus calyciflorus]
MFNLIFQESKLNLENKSFKRFSENIPTSSFFVSDNTSTKIQNKKKNEKRLVSKEKNEESPSKIFLTENPDFSIKKKSNINVDSNSILNNFSDIDTNCQVQIDLVREDKTAFEIEYDDESSNRSFDESDVSQHSLFDDSLSESSSSEDEFANNCTDYEKKFDSKIYPESQLSIWQFFISFYTIKAKHHLSDVACNDLLKFIKKILPENNKCPKTLASFENEIFKSKKVEYSEVCHNC